MFGIGKRTRTRPQIVDVPDRETVEIGSFAHGVCDDCGWRGPGRRSRSMAADDAHDHTCAHAGEEPLSA